MMDGRLDLGPEPGYIMSGRGSHTPAQRWSEEAEGARVSLGRENEVSTIWLTGPHPAGPGSDTPSVVAALEASEVARAARKPLRGCAPHLNVHVMRSRRHGPQSVQSRGLACSITTPPGTKRRPPVPQPGPHAVYCSATRPY